MEEYKKRVLIIGIDGATFDIIFPLIKRGELKTIKRILENGVYTKLESIDPPITAPAWTSAYTGVNPGKHNIFSFNDTNGHVVNATSRKFPAIWQTLSERGFRSLIMHLPVTYPPDQIKGIVLSGMLAPQQILDNIFGEKKILNEEELLFGEEFVEKRGVHYYTNRPKFIREMKRVERMKGDIFKFYLEHEDWDFAWLLFAGTDEMSHLFWDEFESSRKNNDLSPLESIYTVVDKIIGEILNIVNLNNTTVFIMSDHGFGAVKNAININYLLEKKKYLHKRKRSYKNIIKRKIVENGINFSKIPIIKYFVRLSLSLIPLNTRKSLKASYLFDPRSIVDKIDLGKSICYCNGVSNEGEIRITQPMDENEILRLKTKLIKELLDLRDPMSNKPLIAEILDPLDIYNGRFTKNAPLLLLRAKDNYSIKSDLYAKHLLTKPRQSGEHRKDGILMMIGNHVLSTGTEIPKKQIVDITPTIHQLFQIPLFSEFDGRIITEAFPPESKIINTTLKKVSVETKKEINDEEMLFSEEEEMKIRERLSHLGYFD